MQDLVNQVGHDFHESTLLMADELIENIRDAAPKVTGALARSVRKRDVTKIYGNLQQVSVLVIAGGRQTTKRTLTGQSYDYSVATEFGTSKEAPEPFFYNTARLYQYAGLEQYRETLDEAISENNKVRNLRSENYNNADSTRTVSHRGAVVIQKGKR